MPLVADKESTIMNSYVTVQEASAYFAERGHGEAWDDVDNPDALLITATNQLDWFMNFKGSKVIVSQPLEWPRKDVFVNDEYIPITEIPTRLKQAVFELAVASIDDDRMTEDDMTGLQEVRIGSLKVVANMVGPWQSKKRPVPIVIYRILNDYIVNSSTMFRRTERT